MGCKNSKNDSASRSSYEDGCWPYQLSIYVYLLQYLKNSIYALCYRVLRYCSVLPEEQRNDNLLKLLNSTRRNSMRWNGAILRPEA
jgi:hypothetical protein